MMIRWICKVKISADEPRSRLKSERMRNVYKREDYNSLGPQYQPSPLSAGGVNVESQIFIKPWGSLNFHQQGFPYWGDGESPSPTGQKLLILPTGKRLPSRLPPPNFYSPHQRFIPPTQLIQRFY